MAEQMKPSGIDWIGDIPESWDVVRIKDIGTYRNGLTYAPEDIIDDDNGTLVLRSSNIQNGKISYDDNVYVKCSVSPELMVKKGDIIICSRNGSRELIGKNAIIEKSGIACSFGAFMMVYRCSCPRYMYYILNSEVFSYYLGTFLTSTINQLTGNNFGNMKIVFCKDHNERKKIVDFLGKECAQIDSIAANLEKQIALLQQYKKSLITETVTKGLDKSVPMKDSGIEWIGEIPAHWDVEPIKYRVTFHNGDRGENYPSKSELQSEGIPFINAGHLEGDGLNMDNMDYISEEKYRIMGGVKLRSGDILYCLRGSVGKSAIVDMNQGTVASSLVAIRSVRISAEYLYYCLNSYIEEVQRYLWDNGTAQPNLSADNLGKYKICIPTVEEQRTIVKYLNNICSQIDNLIIGKRKQFSTIQQHKKSLIYEYVTGKKRVKEVQ